MVNGDMMLTSGGSVVAWRGVKRDISGGNRGDERVNGIYHGRNGVAGRAW